MKKITELVAIAATSFVTTVLCSVIYNKITSNGTKEIEKDLDELTEQIEDNNRDLENIRSTIEELNRATDEKLKELHNYTMNI